MRWARVKRFSRLAWQLIREAFDEFSKDRGELAAGSLAFFTLLSLAPLIIIAVAVAGVLLGQDAARAETQRVLAQTMGAEAASAVGNWVDQASAASGVASVIGGALLLWTASRFTTQLKLALNHVWNVDIALEEGFKDAVKAYVRRRLFAFVVVLAAGPLLLAAFVSRAFVSGLSSALFGSTMFEGAFASTAQLGLSLALVAGVSMLVYRFVPDTNVGWKVAAMGGAITSVLFNLGNLLVGWYLARAGVGRAYGIAGSVLVVLLWLHFSAQIFILSAEFTQVWARHFGRSLKSGEEQLQRELESAAAASHEREQDCAARAQT